MPIKRVSNGYKFGTKGKVYPTKSGALRQMSAIKASQARRSK